MEVPDDEALIMHALAHVGPLAVSMLTAYPAFDKYAGKGVIVVPPMNCTAPVPDAKLDHSMLLVGYGTSAFGALRLQARIYFHCFCLRRIIS